MTLSPLALQAAFAQETEQVFLVCLRLASPELPVPVCVVRNTQPITHGGEQYLACSFDIKLPTQSDDSVVSVTVSVDNVDRMLVKSLRSATSPVTASLFVVLADTPDVIEAGPFEMTLRDVSYDVLAVSGSLQWEDILNQADPGHYFTPSTTPGIF